MGIFNRNKDEEEVYIDPQPSDQVAASVPAPAPTPSVDGVLPPGVSPTPAPVSNNLASQVAPNASAIHTTAVPAPQSNDTPLEDTAGDYIMTAPPMQQQADEWSEASQEMSTNDVVEPSPGVEPTTHVEVEAPEPEPQELAPENQEPTQPEPEPQQTSQDGTPFDLADIKQQALQQLSPLVAHLEQSPEERFHTTMMLLQSTDDKTLIKPAYEAAQAITDDKTRAQALLDIVNEINYLNQKS